jgi:hypothetical protein
LWDEITGDFTILKYVKDISRDDLEDRCGYERGRLDDGATIIVLDGLEKMTPSDFELGASTRWSRSSAAAPWAPWYVVDPSTNLMTSNAIEIALSDRGKNVWDLKTKVSNFFNKGGDNRPAKIIPRRHRFGDQYPDAIWLAVPQFKLINRKRFVEFKVVMGRSGAV